jgi:hypothetical protein
MNDFEFELDEYSKPKKIRKTKVHQQPIIFDDDGDEVYRRKQAGKKKHSSRINNFVEYGLDDEDEIEQYIHYLK